MRKMKKNSEILAENGQMYEINIKLKVASMAALWAAMQSIQEYLDGEGIPHQGDTDNYDWKYNIVKIEKNGGKS